MKNILKTFYILILFIFSLVIQLFVFNNINLFGVKPNILFISCIVMGLYTNIYLSTIYSFTLGVVVDLLFGSLGMFTISYTAVGMLIGFVGQNYIKENYVSILILTAISVTLFEIMIKISKYISFIFLFKELIISIMLNVVLVFILCFTFGKLMEYIDKKQNKLYW